MAWAIGTAAVLGGALLIIWRLSPKTVADEPLPAQPPAPTAEVVEDPATPPTAPGRRTQPDDDDLVEAFGLEDEAPARGTTPVVVVPRAIMPGTRFASSNPLEIDEDLAVAFVHAKETGSSWVVLVTLRDPDAGPKLANLHGVGCLLKVENWMGAGHGLTGHLLEPADLTLRSSGEGFEADYVLRDWMGGVNGARTKIEALAGLLQTERPENPATWLAAHSDRLGACTQAHIEAGAAKVVEAIDRSVPR